MNPAGATAQPEPAAARRRLAFGAMWVALAGVLFLVADGPLSGLSHDLAYLLRRREVPPEAVLVLMDEASHRTHAQPLLQPWDRRLHARLVRGLASHGPRAIVLDSYMPIPGDPAADGELVAAAREFGKVAVAANVARDEEIGGAGAGLEAPFDALREVVRWGPAEALPGIVREAFQGLHGRPSLPEEAAALATGGGSGDTGPGARRAATLPGTRYLRYFGPPGTFKFFSYADVLAGRIPGSHFSNVVVLVGVAYKGPQLAGGRNASRVGGDNLPTPFQRFGSGLSTGVEVLATAVVNEIRGEFLRRPGPWTELALVVVAGASMTFLLSRFRPLPATAVTVGLAVAVALAGTACPWWTGVWFPWLIPAVVQFPLALAWCAVPGLARRGSVAFDPAQPAQAPVAGTAPLSSPPVAAGSASLAATRASHGGEEATRLDPEGQVQVLAEHVLLREIGRGGYGEVWLARDALGTLRAIKVIDRQSFSDDRPFDREFEGIRRFRPLSLKHPGLVNILHVGRDEARRRFHYVMEAADDESGRKNADPEEYVPRTLDGDLRRRGALRAVEAVAVGIGVGEALAFLHAHGLVHRDVKPGNILFVEGRPKLADVGLVTEMANTGREVSQVGTLGYLPPEGAGTAQADVYALGMLLYVALTGRPPKEFPVLPADIEARPDAAEAFALNQVLLKACERDPGERYATMEEMLAGLRSMALTRDRSP